jgi:glycopeptide antibiotics resistance protein
MLFGIIIPVLISFACEVFQYIFVCGDADIDDIIANTLGAIIGVVLYKLIVKDLRRKQC